MGLSERESQRSHLQGRDTEAARFSGWVVRRQSQLSYDLQVNFPDIAAALDIFFIKKIKSKGSYRLCLPLANIPPKK